MLSLLGGYLACALAQDPTASPGPAAVVNCAVGTYKFDSYTCVACTPGKYTDVANQLDGCTDCTAGRYVEQYSAEVCDECTAGTYAANAGADACDVCQWGQYATSDSSTSCDTCTACAGKPTFLDARLPILLSFIVC
jgi:hypothetical protein